MYKIWNKLFGWDYIHWENIADSGISRIFITKDNKLVYWRYKFTRVLDHIRRPNDVTWLTCSPDKYLKRIGEV